MVMEIVFAGLLLIVIVLLGILILRKPSTEGSDASAMLLKQDLTTLSSNVVDLKDGIQKQIDEKLGQSNRQMVAQFSESAKIIKDVTQKLTELDKTNRQVSDVASELRALQNVLQNPKQRGVLGEYYLAQVLENVLPPEGFRLQHRFKDGEIVDAVVCLDKGKLLSVDSKFSLENYNRLVEEPDKVRREVHARAFKADLKLRIDETSKYIRPKEDTMDFAFMFIPSEAIYNDLLTNKVGMTNTSARDLIEYAFRDKHVIIVSPTTFMAYLQTVMQGLRSLQIEEQAKDIQQRVGELGRHIASYDVFMGKLGTSLGTTVNHYNSAHKELKKIDKDVMKIAHTSPAVEPLLLERPTTDED